MMSLGPFDSAPRELAAPAPPLALHALHRPVVTGLIDLNRLRDWWEERAS